MSKKFSDMHPNMKCILEECHGVIRGRSKYPCTICGCMTEYIEINYEAPFCSEDCIWEMDRRANKHDRYDDTFL